MKKCIVISDSFKGTLSSQEICEIARQSIPRIFPDCQIVAIPVADGGEGTTEAIIYGRKNVNAERISLIKSINKMVIHYI